MLDAHVVLTTIAILNIFLNVCILGVHKLILKHTINHTINNNKNALFF